MTKAYMKTTNRVVMIIFLHNFQTTAQMSHKFHYTDFATNSADFVADTNHESLRHKSCRRFS